MMTRSKTIRRAQRMGGGTVFNVSIGGYGFTGS